MTDTPDGDGPHHVAVVVYLTADGADARESEMLGKYGVHAALLGQADINGRFISYQLRRDRVRIEIAEVVPLSHAFEPGRMSIRPGADPYRYQLR